MRWRPSDKCIYVVPDIHGANSLLVKLLNAILPLNEDDKLIFLGDYIDRHIDSHLVLDTVIDVKSKHEKQVKCLIGNHELMLCQAIGLVDHEAPDAMFHSWILNGGYQTIQGYMYRNNIRSNLVVNMDSFSKLLPPEHIKFLEELGTYHIHEQYKFVHAGCNPMLPMQNYDIEQLVWDRGLFRSVVSLIKNGKEPVWDGILVVGHNKSNGIPIITNNYMMLDCGSPNRLILAELNSRTALFAKPGINGLLEVFLDNTRPEVLI